MRKLLATICLLSACSLTLAETGPLVKKAYVDQKGWVHIATADGHDNTIEPQKWQAGGGFESVDVALDRRTVGWIADQKLTPLQCATSYSCSVGLELDIWRYGRVIRRFPAPVLVIQDWTFLKNGKEVAIHVSPMHGQEFYDCTLFDVNTGKKLAHWALDNKGQRAPDWVEQLLGDSLPASGRSSN